MHYERLAEDVIIFRADCREAVPTLGTLDCVVTDPPYGMAFQSNHRTVKHRAIANDDATDLLDWACRLNARHSVYAFGRWDNVANVPRPKSLITWVKNNWSMGDLKHEHARQSEVIFFYPGSEHSWPGKRPTDVVTAARTRNDHHPTEKPVDLMEIVLSWTAGQVLDPFMGSGTTGIAAVRLGRPFVGVEIDSIHFDTARRRISEALRSRPAPRPKIDWSALIERRERQARLAAELQARLVRAA